MSIPNIGADTAGFLAVMTGIAAGLFVFAIGKGANVMGDALSAFTGNFADNIKTDITTLLSILNDDNISVKKSEDFSTIMGNIAEGLAKFGLGKFVGVLTGAASAALNFLSGSDSPVQEVMKLASKSKELTEGADAMSKIGDGLDKMSALKFDGSKLNIEEFAEDLMKSIPALEVAIQGGTVGEGWFSSGEKIQGLASTDIGWTQAATNINLLKDAFSQVNSARSGSSGGASAEHDKWNIDGAPQKRQTGGPVTKGTPYIVGENTLQGELFVPSESGAIINAQRTQQIQQAGLQRGDASTAAPTIVNAPSNTVVDNKQSNTTNTTVSFSHPSPILNAVNVAA
jgi:hypothetical protein